MNLDTLFTKTLFQAKKHAPVLFAGAAVAGVVGTGYLSAKGATYSWEALLTQRARAAQQGLNRKERTLGEIKAVWRDYIPAVVVGSGTVVCIAAATRVGLARAAAAQAALIVAERAYDEYRGEVVKEYGEQKDKEIRARVAENRVNENPSPAIMMLGEGSVMSCDMQSMRYFMATMEDLRKAENDLNAELLRNETATLTDFYILLGIDPTRDSDSLGWFADKLMELQINPVMGPNGTPCLAFDFNYIRPIYERWEQ